MEALEPGPGKSPFLKSIDQAGADAALQQVDAAHDGEMGVKATTADGGTVIGYLSGKIKGWHATIFGGVSKKSGAEAGVELTHKLGKD